MAPYSVHRNILPLAVITATAVYIYLLGPNNVLTTLGWSASLLALIVIFSIVSINTNLFSRSIFFFNLLFVGVIFMNHLTHYILTNKKSLPFNLLTLTIFVQPFALIICSFGGILDSLIKRKYSSKEEEANISRLTFFPIYIIAVSGYIYSMAAAYLAYNSQEMYKGIYAFIFIWCLAFAIILLFSWRLTSAEIEYALKPIHRLPEASGIKRKIEIFLYSSLLLSIVFEYFRGLWVFGILSMALVILILLTVSHFYKHVFMLQPEYLAFPPKLHFPNMLSRRSLIINFVIFVFVLPTLLGIAVILQKN